MKNIVGTTVAILILTSLACSSTTLAPSTETPTSVPTVIPTSTSRPTPTQPAREIPSLGNFEMGAPHMVVESGFSFRAPMDFYTLVEEGVALTFDLSQAYNISMYGDVSTEPGEQILDSVLERLRGSGEMQITRGEAQPVIVNDASGFVWDLSGTLNGDPFAGEAFVLFVSADHFVLGIGTVTGQSAQAAWDADGTRVMQAIMNSVEYIDPAANTCLISTDETYGYTGENPIRVGDGGSFMGGPVREREYLDNLRGPNGEALVYERLGSTMVEETILDMYAIDGLDQDVVLYLDIYHFEPLSAPVGFTCLGPFNTGP